MQALNFLGIEISSEEENEIIVNNPKGLRAIVRFVNGVTETFTKITEVHWLYPGSLNERRVALESVILGTGWTYATDSIVSIDIDTE